MQRSAPRQHSQPQSRLLSAHPLTARALRVRLACRRGHLLARPSCRLTFRSAGGARRGGGDGSRPCRSPPRSISGGATRPRPPPLFAQPTCASLPSRMARMQTTSCIARSSASRSRDGGGAAIAPAD
eukprot:359029-Chlamydomonas_euryale.AAC.5